MNLNTHRLHDMGQRIRLGNITRQVLRSGTLARYTSDLSVTGLTSNSTIVEAKRQQRQTARALP